MLNLNLSIYDIKKKNIINQKNNTLHDYYIHLYIKKYELIYKSNKINEDEMKKIIL